MIQRGQIWVGNLNPTRGNELGKIRPVLILQADVLTQAQADTVLVLPLTTQLRPNLKLFRVPVLARERLLEDSYIAIEKIRALDPTRIGDGPLTTLTGEEMRQVEHSLLAVLGMHTS